MHLSQSTIKQFQEKIYGYYLKNKRHFSWRETTDPYAIFVSEVMLQQTQTSRVEPKYREFLAALPNFQALANASTAQVLRLWQGLGYNRRALNLQRAAQIITKEYNSQLPDDTEKLVCLPGIGPATAASITAFAFNKPVVFIETNIRRVFIDHFFPGEESISDKDIRSLIEQTLDRDNPREWYWALMDYGAHLLKVQTNPNRRSRHYTKQSKFEGSNRQLRGEILRALLTEEATLPELAKKLSVEIERVKTALAQLQAEGFVVFIDGQLEITKKR